MLHAYKYLYISFVCFVKMGCDGDRMWCGCGGSKRDEKVHRKGPIKAKKKNDCVWRTENETNNLYRKSFSNLNYVFKCCHVDSMCTSHSLLC